MEILSFLLEKNVFFFLTTKECIAEAQNGKSTIEKKKKKTDRKTENLFSN